jgi:hypothetical protein
VHATELAHALPAFRSECNISGATRCRAPSRASGRQLRPAGQRGRALGQCATAREVRNPPDRCWSGSRPIRRILWCRDARTRGRHSARYVVVQSAAAGRANRYRWDRGVNGGMRLRGRRRGRGKLILRDSQRRQGNQRGRRQQRGPHHSVSCEMVGNQHPAQCYGANGSSKRGSSSVSKGHQCPDHRAEQGQPKRGGPDPGFRGVIKGRGLSAIAWGPSRS